MWVLKNSLSNLYFKSFDSPTVAQWTSEKNTARLFKTLEEAKQVAGLFDNKVSVVVNATTFVPEMCE